MSRQHKTQRYRTVVHLAHGKRQLGTDYDRLASRFEAMSHGSASRDPCELTLHTSPRSPVLICAIFIAESCTTIFLITNAVAFEWLRLVMLTRRMDSSSSQRARHEAGKSELG